MFGSDCSLEKAKGKGSAAGVVGGDRSTHEMSSEVSPPTKAVRQRSDASKVPTRHQRKLAVEEMVIRDHLGQEVGSMDAVGQKQRPIEDHVTVGNGDEEWKQPDPQASENEPKVKWELGSRDSPEGQSPTFQINPNTARILGNRYIEFAKRHVEESAMRAAQKELAKEGEMDKTPTAEPMKLESHGREESTVVGRRQERRESWPEQSLSEQGTNGLDLDQAPLEEAQAAFLDPVPGQSAFPLQEGTDSCLPDHIPSPFQGMGKALQDVVPSLLSNQGPLILLDPSWPAQSREEYFQNQFSSSQQESLFDAGPLALQGRNSSPLEQNPPPPQGESISPQDSKLSWLNQLPLSLQEAIGEHLDQLPGILQDQSITSLLTPLLISLPEHLIYLPEVKLSLPEQSPSSLPSTGSSLQQSMPLQDQQPSGQEAKESLPGLTCSTNQSGVLPDQITALQEKKKISTEEITLALQENMPIPLEAQLSSLPEADTERKTPSSEQEDGGALPKPIQSSLPSQTAPSHLEAKGVGSVQPPSSFQEEIHMLPDLAPATNSVQRMTRQGPPTVPQFVPSSSQDPGQPPLDKAAMGENQEPKEAGDANLFPAAKDKIPDVLGNLQAEQQPLLKGPRASVALPDVSAGDPQSKAGIIKPEIATGQETPIYATTSAANTASECELQPIEDPQGESDEEEQTKQKQKSCQCCSIM